MGKREAGGWRASEEAREEHDMHKERRERTHNVDEIRQGKAWMRSSEGAVGEVVLRLARLEHVHAARSRTFRLAREPSMRDKKKGRITSNLKIHADSPIRWKRLGAT